MKQPLSHQLEAIGKATDYFRLEDKGQLIMACGTGKTLTALWIAESLGAKNIIISLPSLQLQQQSIVTWITEASNLHFKMLAIGSDNYAEIKYKVPSTTDVGAIAEFLQSKSKNPKIIFTTYQSTDRLIAASKLAKITFDLAIVDEAHRTAGKEGRKFGLILNHNLPISKKLFMTATQKFFENDNVLSMDNKDIYGSVFYRLTTEDAIKKGILSDYKVVVIYISNPEAIDLIVKGKNLAKVKNIIAFNKYFVMAEAICKAINKYKLSKTITFHRSIELANTFKDVVSEIDSSIAAFSISNQQNIKERVKVIDNFKNSSKSLVSNPKILLEGADIPEVDCVSFVDAKKSHVEVIQAIGRCLRRHKSKAMGYVLLPVFIDEKGVVNKEDFKNISNALTAIGSTDSRVFSDLNDIADGKNSKRKVLKYIKWEKNKLVQDFPFDKVQESISLRVWQRVRRISRVSYAEAKEYARDLAASHGINSSLKWQDLVKGKIPGLKIKPEVPNDPQMAYLEEFEGWPEFLGNQKITFSQLREIAIEIRKEHNITSLAKWKEYVRSNKNKYPDVSISPEHFVEYVSAYDFLGLPTPSEPWNYETAKKWAHENLQHRGIKTKQDLYGWITGKLDIGIEKPEMFPASPSYFYKVEWEGYPEFLGTPSKISDKWMDFEDARTLANEMAIKYGINSNKKWKQWFNGELNGVPEPPPGLPFDARVAYLSRWRSWGFFFKLKERFKDI